MCILFILHIYCISLYILYDPFRYDYPGHVDQNSYCMFIFPLKEFIVVMFDQNVVTNFAFGTTVSQPFPPIA